VKKTKFVLSLKNWPFYLFPNERKEGFAKNLKKDGLKIKREKLFKLSNNISLSKKESF
jgi:hypothetical protein